MGGDATQRNANCVGARESVYFIEKSRKGGDSFYSSTF